MSVRISLYFSERDMTKRIRTLSKNKELVSERREQIINCAIQVFIKNGYEETKMDEVANACGMSKGLLYYYVSSKEDILYLIVNNALELGTRSFANMQETYGNLSPTEALRESIKRYYNNIHRLQDYQVFLNQAAAKLPKKDRPILFNAEHNGIDYFTRLLKRGVELGEFEMEDCALTAHNILLIGRAWADRRWFLQKHYSIEEYIRIQTEAILKEILVSRNSEITSKNIEE